MDVGREFTTCRVVAYYVYTNQPYVYLPIIISSTTSEAEETYGGRWVDVVPNTDNDDYAYVYGRLRVDQIVTMLKEQAYERIFLASDSTVYCEGLTKSDPRTHQEAFRHLRDQGDRFIEVKAEVYSFGSKSMVFPGPSEW